MTFKYDTSETGLNAFFKNYQILSLNVLWETGGSVSKEVWIKVNEKLGMDSISRASIINFLEDMRSKGAIKGEETTGKGGRYFIYSISMTEHEFKTYLAQIVIESLNKNFPVATQRAIKNTSG